MTSKQKLLTDVKDNRNLHSLNELLKIEYEELKEKLVDQLNIDELKRLQGEGRRLRQLIQLTNKTVSR